MSATVRPEMLLKCAAARYGGDFTKRLARAPLLSESCQQQRFFTSTRIVAWGSKEFFHNDSKLRNSEDFLHLDHHNPQDVESLHYEIPMNVRQKVVDSKDAVALVRDGDTVCVSGFVCQGTPEAVLQALGEKYEKKGSPNKLTLLFGGGPGDWDYRGLNHLAKEKEGEPPMLRRTVGSHYGQVPKVAELALQEKTEAWTLPMGSVSRMIRAQSTHSPGHITSVGIGSTYAMILLLC